MYNLASSMSDRINFRESVERGARDDAMMVDADVLSEVDEQMEQAYLTQVLETTKEYGNIGEEDWDEAEWIIKDAYLAAFRTVIAARQEDASQ